MAGPITCRRSKGSGLSYIERDRNLAIETAQVAHGLAAGDLVYVSAGGWGLADAADEDKIDAGFVLAALDADTVLIVTQHGTAIRLPGHGLGSRGAMTWLAQGSPGALTATEPSSGIIRRVGPVLDADTVLYAPSAYEVL